MKSCLFCTFWFCNRFAEGGRVALSFLACNHLAEGGRDVCFVLSGYEILSLKGEELFVFVLSGFASFR